MSIASIHVWSSFNLLGRIVFQYLMQMFYLFRYSADIQDLCRISLILNSLQFTRGHFSSSRLLKLWDDENVFLAHCCFTRNLVLSITSCNAFNVENIFVKYFRGKMTTISLGWVERWNTYYIHTFFTAPRSKIKL